MRVSPQVDSLPLVQLHWCVLHRQPASNLLVMRRVHLHTAEVVQLHANVSAVQTAAVCPAVLLRSSCRCSYCYDCAILTFIFFHPVDET